MRLRHWLAGFAVTASTFGLVAAGCGGTTDSGPTDAGNDTVSEKAVVQDTGPDAVEDTAIACVDADLNTINPGDAAIGDSGASVGTCLQCARTSCPTQISACNADCACKDAVVGFAGCVQTMPVTTCGAALTGTSLGQDLALCLIGSCRPACGQGAIPRDAGDAG